MYAPIRVLLLADSHLGLDLPVRPRVERRRRGYDFLANYAAALAPAFAGEIDIVVHGGDVFDRPRVAGSIAYRAFEPLRRVADSGVPVFVVPGNHERSRLPHARVALHPNIHVFDAPRAFAVDVRGQRLVVAGFPYQRRNLRRCFPELVEQTGWRSLPATLRLLCIHHCVEGATVGPGNHTFRAGDDVIRGADIPGDFAAVLSGHIHRHQVLSEDLRGRPLAAPVLYPGSIERTSSAEIGETKGFLVLDLVARGEPPVRWEFRELYARPLLRRRLSVDGMSGGQLDAAVRAIIGAAPRDAVLGIRLEGTPSDAHLRCLSATHLRSFAPETMNVEIRVAAAWGETRRRRSEKPTEVETSQLDLLGV